MDTDEESEGALVRNQASQDQIIALDLDDDADFVEGTRVRAQLRTLNHWRSLKGACSFDQACASFTKYYENKLASSSNNNNDNDDPFSIMSCVALLSIIPNVSEEIYIKALKVIGSNRSWREFFVCVPENIRLMLLDPSDLDHYLECFTFSETACIFYWISLTCS